jgi:hypothetical protein
MTEAIKYVVVCDCGGALKPIAYIDDNRPVNGALRVDARVGQMIVIAPELSGGEEPRDSPDAWAAMFTEHNVTRVHWNRWGDDHITWVIRCGDCSKQAQMEHGKFEALADGLAAGRGELVMLSVPSAHNLDVIEQRYKIQLGVLCRWPAQLKG